jgi:hypothetical protein
LLTKRHRYLQKITSVGITGTKGGEDEFDFTVGGMHLFSGRIGRCGGLKQIQDTIARFDQGAHSVSTAEMNFFRAVQTADCTNQFYITQALTLIATLA